MAPRKTQERALQTRADLLAAALQAFSDQGYDGSSLRQIEAQAGLQRGLAAYHFVDKEGLWRAVLEQLFTALQAGFLDQLPAPGADGEGADGEGAGRLQARQLVRAFVLFSAAHPQLNRIMMQESSRDSWRMDYIVDQQIRPLMARVAARHPDAARLLWGNNDPHRYYAFIGTCAFVFTAGAECRRLFGEDALAPGFVERHAATAEALLIPA